MKLEAKKVRRNGVKRAIRPSRPPRKRREQQRAIDTQKAILDAALIEFADKGFEGASTRAIAARAGLTQPLLAYHFRSNSTLWRAVASHHIGEIRKLWDENIPYDSQMSSADILRVEFRTFLQFTVLHPQFHHFMIREAMSSGPRLTWLVRSNLIGMMDRTVPHIKTAQKNGEVLLGNPLLVYYMLLGMTSVLSSMSGQMRSASGIIAFDPKIVDTYWNLIEQAIFK